MVQSFNEGERARAVVVGSVWSDGPRCELSTGRGLVVVTEVAPGLHGERCVAASLDGAVLLRGRVEVVLDGYAYVGRVPLTTSERELGDANGRAVYLLRAAALALACGRLGEGGPAGGEG